LQLQYGPYKILDSVLSMVNRYIHWLALTFLTIMFGLHVWVLVSIPHISLDFAIKDSGITVITFALYTWCVILLIRAYPTKVAIVSYAAILALLFASMNAATDWLIFKYWLGRNNLIYSTWLQHSLSMRMITHSLLLLWVATYVALKKKTDSLEDKFLKQADATSLLREAELFKLRQQLQPHFLYNSLNSISALIMIQPDKAQEMIGKLSDFLRSSVKSEAQDLMPIAEELNYIESYLAIEAVRFGDRLQVHFEKEYTDNAKVPPFLMQPILENAVKYGLYGKTGNVIITVHIALQDNMLVITITNPYDEGQTRSSKGTGFGLEGIRRRLYLLYARTDLLETQKTEQLFTTILKIPQAYA